MKKALSVLAMLLISSIAQGQTTTTRTLEYQYDNATPTIVATWTQVVRVNGNAIAAKPICSAAGVNTICRVALPTLNANTNNVISVTASDVDESMESVLNYNPSVVTTDPNSPKLPTGMTIKITVTVIVGQ